MLKRYRVVGWYSEDAGNPHIAPLPRVVTVEAVGPDEAYERGGDELEKLYLADGRSMDFLNWFIKELPACDGKVKAETDKK